MKWTKIEIDHSLCGNGGGIDPRECGLCLKTCEPAVFLLHQSEGEKQENPLDPDKWCITPLWLSLCTRCMKCVEICPEDAIKVK